MIFDAIASLRQRPTAAPQNVITAADVMPGVSSPVFPPGTAAAMRLSAVNRCIEVLSDSIAKLPIYFYDSNGKKRVPNDLDRLLSIRPNEAMTPFVLKKMVEASRLTTGNGYIWIWRDSATMRPTELLPVPAQLVSTWRDTNGHVWHDITNPVSGEQLRLPDSEMIHLKAYSDNGIKGVSVLSRAAEVIESGRAAQQYDLAYYQNGARPSGVLTTDSDVGGTADVKKADGTVETVSKKELIRREWEKIYGGAANSHRTAILDFGLKYQPIAISQADSQFVEREELSIQDIARFFGVPLYKLQSGKQSYNSNEQNSIEYVVGTLHPIVTQYEEEMSYKLLSDQALAAGLELRINMMAELKGDTASRSAWYKNMREIGAMSPNDIRALEDMPDIEGGDSYYASWNYGPLSRWEELSVARAGLNNRKKE